ncbi:hypothetical protein ACQ4PT_041728 [Festuca glaucescens]
MAATKEERISNGTRREASERQEVRETVKRTARREDVRVTLTTEGEAERKRTEAPSLPGNIEQRHFLKHQEQQQWQQQQMAVASLQCYPLLNSPPVSFPGSLSARTPVRRRTGQATRSQLRRCYCSQSTERRSPDNSPPQLERLFSNVNQATMKHEPGSVIGSILLVAGTTVGAGILAIPAVTQEAGFLASAVTCIFCWMHMVVTGLLVAEVNVNTMCELGSGGVSLVSMAKRTQGTFGVRTAWYDKLHITAVYLLIRTPNCDKH